jgi:hypothetical protein
MNQILGLELVILYVTRKRPYILEVHTQPTNVYKFKIFIILVYLYTIENMSKSALVFHI